MENFLRENLEKMKKEFEEEVREVIERLEKKLKILGAKLQRKIGKNGAQIKSNHLDVNNQLYVEGLLNEAKLQVMDQRHLSKLIFQINW
jgi:hypothetical protein